MKHVLNAIALLYCLAATPVFAQLPAEIDMANLTPENRAQMLLVYGWADTDMFPTNGDGLGGFDRGLAFGDFNGDGYDDLLLGTMRNRVYIVFGAADLPGLEFEAATTLDVTPDARVLSLNGMGGQTVSCGDVNGDGFDDVIGSRNNGGGTISIVFGRAGNFGGQTISVNQGGQPLADEARIIGATIAKMVCSGGDLNGDSYDDIAFSTFNAEGAGLPADDGVIVLYGSPTLPGTIVDLSTSTEDVLVAGETRILSRDPVFGDDIGHGLEFGDVNLDGIADLLIGAPKAGDVGEAYIIFGEPDVTDTYILLSEHGSQPSNTLERKRKHRTRQEKYLRKIQKLSDGQYIGYATAVGLVEGLLDVNYGLPPKLTGEGQKSTPQLNALFEPRFPALITAQPFQTYHNRIDCGSGIVLMGDILNQPGDFAFDIDAPPVGYTLFQGGEENDFIENVACGDLNGDGIGDMILGATLASPLGRAFSGKAYVMYGRDELTNRMYDMNSAGDGADAVIYGRLAQEGFSTVIAAKGDLNRDGFSEFAIAAPVSDNPFVDNGLENDFGGYVAVFFGSGDNNAAADSVATQPNFTGRRAIGGRLSPVIRATVSYNGGVGPGGLASNTLASIFRTQTGLGGAGLGPLSGVAAVYWQLQTDRTGFSTATVELQYTDAEIAGVDENVLRLLRADSADGPWVEIEGAVFDPAKNTVTAGVNRLGYFALAEPDPNVEILNYLIGAALEPPNADQNGDMVVDTADLVTQVNGD